MRRHLPSNGHGKSRNSDSTHYSRDITAWYNYKNDNTSFPHFPPSGMGLNRPRLGDGRKMVLSQKTMIIVLGCLGVAFLIAVHMYLFLTVMIPSTANVTTPMDFDRFRESYATKFSSSLSGGIGGFQTQSTFSLTPLRSIDYEYYTIRINTWRRPKQLVASVVHHASCPGVKKIQIVWCDSENEPPSELFDTSINPHYSKVYIERHDDNSLNERFRVLDSTTPTLGILSIDDDVLRPCSAIDSGFFKWTKSPNRMVGFDARVHVENPDGTWAYGYLSTTRKQNRYSMSLTRYCFVHRDYMNQYMERLPKRILDTVGEHFNCEDIAMSFLISSLTQGQPPLLADTWAMNMQLKLHVDDKISGGKDHKKFRDQCVETFSQLLSLKDNAGSNGRLQKAKIIHSKHPYFVCGATVDDQMKENYTKSQREIKLYDLVRKWKTLGQDKLKKEFENMMREAGRDAQERGLLGNSNEKKE